jgi:cytochrome c-type biogenesis protein CcmH/NrfG
MADGLFFDVVLFGYRNDLARERVLESLHELPRLPAGPAPLGRDTPLPQRLFTTLELERAQQVCAQLEQLGAQVGMLQVGVPPVIGRSVAAVDAERWRIRPLTVVLVLLLGGAIFLFPLTRPVPAPRRQPVLRPATALEPLRTPPERVDAPLTAQLNTDAIQLTAAGKFADAVERLEHALRLLPNDPVLTRNLQTVLLNWGLADLGADKLADASDHLQRAARLGERAEVLRAQGVVYVRQAKYARATAALEQALQMAPQDPHALLALADAYLKQDKRPQALEVLQRAKEAGVRGPGLDKTVQQLSREVDAEWDFTQQQSRHFRASFADDDDRSTIRPVLNALEDAYDAVGRKFDFYPDDRTSVVLYAQRDFHTVTQTPDWAGAAFDGRIKLPVGGVSADDPAFQRVVRHEYAHSLVAQLAGPGCPVWLNEGLAVWAEEDLDRDHEEWAERHVADRELFRLGQLNGSFTVLPAGRVDVAYAESYLAVRALVDRYGARKIPKLLNAIRDGHNFSEAFESVYPGDFAGFERDFLQQIG